MDYGKYTILNAHKINDIIGIGVDFIYNGNIEITNCDLLARNIIVNGNIRMYGQGVINGISLIKFSGSIHTNGNVIVDIIETKGNIISSSGSVIARNSLKANNIFVKKKKSDVSMVLLTLMVI